MALLGELYGVVSTALIGNLLSSLVASILWGQSQRRSFLSAGYPNLTGGLRAPLFKVAEVIPEGPAAVPPAEEGFPLSVPAVALLPLAFMAFFAVMYLNRAEARSPWADGQLEAWQWVALVLSVTVFMMVVLYVLGVFGKGRTSYYGLEGDGYGFLNVYTGSILVAGTLMLFQLFRQQACDHHRHGGRRRHEAMHHGGNHYYRRY